MPKPSIVVFSSPEARGAALADRLQATGLATVEQIVCSRERLAEAVLRHRPVILLVDLSDEPKATLDRLEALPAARPALFFCGPTDDSKLLLRAMKLLPRAYLPDPPTLEELRTALEGFAASEQSTDAAVPCPLIGVVGARPGVGATVIACNLASALGRTGARSALVDLDLEFGDVSIYLDLNPTYTLLDVAEKQGDIDEEFMNTLVERHASGVSVVAAPATARRVENLDLGHVDLMLGMLRRAHDWVVLDVPRRWSDLSARALESADHLVVVTTAELPALTHAKRFLEELEHLRPLDASIHLVVNRHDKRAGLSKADVHKFLEREPELVVPSDYKHVMEHIHEGRTLDPGRGRSPLTDTFAALAQQVQQWCGVSARAESEPSARPARRGWLGRR